MNPDILIVYANKNIIIANPKNRINSARTNEKLKKKIIQKIILEN